MTLEIHVLAWDRQNKVHLTIALFFHLIIALSVHLTIALFFHLIIALSVHLTIALFFHLIIALPVHLTIALSIHSMSLTVTIFMFTIELKT